MKKGKNNSFIMKIISVAFFISTLNVTNLHAQRTLFDNFKQRTKATGKFAHFSNTSGAYRSGAIPTSPCFRCGDNYSYAGGLFTADQWKRFNAGVANGDVQNEKYSIEILRQTVSELSRQIETLREEMDHIRSVLIIDSKLSSKQTSRIR
jgi:crotonobetainyl-CoA:carnitine CoA-transferase CaiB-like acyl-CoA transferase